MCGIVGYIGEKNASQILFNGLKRLEYRGYDSVGIAVLNEHNKIDYVKKMGRVNSIECKLCDLRGGVGIGHTRWATHGVPSDVNAHPHIKNKFAVVHNGIIENFKNLKKKYLNNVNFKSETDSEVIAMLLDKFYDGDILSTLSKVLPLLEGSFALAIMSEYFPNTLAVARHNNPLIVAKNEHESFIASDCPAFSGYAKEIYVMQDDEICLVGEDKIEFFDSNLNPIVKCSIDIEDYVNEDFSDENGFFMRKEISEIPEALKDTYTHFFKNPGLEEFKQKIKDIKKITIFGCGTAYHSGVVGKYLIESLTRIPVTVEIASEYRYQNPIMQEGELFIGVSQSGETADTLASAKMIYNLKQPLVVITNAPYSSITRYADFVFNTQAKAEIAVAATKSYCCQLETFYMLALTIMQVKWGRDISNELANFKTLFNFAKKMVEDNADVKKLANSFLDRKSVFFIGRQLDYAVALESSLKLKEVTYMHSEGYPAGELKHGTIALIDNDAVVFAIITQRDVAKKSMNAIHEVKARGATVVLLTSLSEYFNCEEVDYLISLPSIEESLMPILTVIPMQQFALEVALLKGFNPDKPRNLAKSVTVE